jgi:hypothetical protein
LAMMHGWLVDVHIRGFDLHLRPSIWVKNATLILIEIMWYAHLNKHYFSSGFRLHRSCMDGMFFKSSWKV